MNDEAILNYYYYGFELNYNGMNFPMWFKNGWEKVACLSGFNDSEMGVVKEKEEILKEIKKILR